MPYIQDFPVSQGSDLDVEFEIVPPGVVVLAGATVKWRAYQQAFGVPTLVDDNGNPIPPVIEKDSSDPAQISILESPEMFTVHLVDADTSDLDLGNYYHEAKVTDFNGNDTPVTVGMMTVTMSLIQGS